MNGPVTLVCPVLVGRDELLAIAEARLAEARGGQGRLLFLAGEAGVGKTRLLGSVERRATGLGFRVARGGTYPGDLEVAGAILLDLAWNLGRIPSLAATGAAIADRMTTADALNAATGRTEDGEPSGDAHRQRRMLAFDLAEMMASLADAGPIVLALEDLHQSDDLTLEVLDVLSRRAADLPLLVIGTFRTDELYPRTPMRTWRAHLLTKRLAEEVRLERLSVEGTATMLAVLLARDGPPPRVFVEMVHRRTDGIPLHVEELVGLLAAAGELHDDALPADVPDTLDGAILGRLARRSDRARRVAEVGAVIGRSFELDLLAETLAVEVETLSRPLEELADHFILSESATSGRYGFRHGLICDAIYARIPTPRRRSLHAAVAERAARRGDFSDAFLSSHFERAGDRARAFETALRAARAASTMSSHREALQLYERVLRNLPRGMDPSDEAALREGHGFAAAACDENEAAADSFEAARAGWLAAARPTEAAKTVAPLVAARHLLGDDLEARTGRLKAAIADLEGVPDSPERDVARARLLAGLAAAYMLDRRLDAATAVGEASRELAFTIGDPATERNAAITVGASLVFAGRMDDGWTRMEDGLRRSREARLEAEAARAYRMIGSCASVLVEYDRAERWLREGIEYAERAELWNDRHYMAAHLAHVLWATGRWDDAREAAEHALADGRGGITTRITAQHALGYVALGRGEFDAARAALVEALTAGERMRELQRSSPALWGLAEVDLLAGDAAGAADRCQQGLAASAAVDDGAYLFPFLVTGTRALLALRDPGAAGHWVETVGVRLRRRAIPGTLPAIDHAEGLVALATGSTGRARERLGAAAGAWRARGRRWEGVAALADLADCELRTNRLAEAVRYATEGRAVAVTMGAPSLVERMDAVIGRVRAAHPTDAPWAPLTAREFEVARLVATGGTNTSIAEELGIASRTVASHVEHILDKLGAERRSEIAAWAATVSADRTPT